MNKSLPAGILMRLVLAFNSFALTLLLLPSQADAQTWLPVGTPGFSVGAAGFTSMAINGGTPYVAYTDAGNFSKATVQKFNGSSWMALGGPGLSTGVAYYTMLAFNGSTPYVAFSDQAGGYAAVVMTYNGTSWTTIGGGYASPNQAVALSFALDGSTPYIAYSDPTNGYKATVRMYNGTSWIAVGAPFSTGITYPLSIAISAGVPYVAYSDAANGGSVEVKMYNGTTWVSVGSALSSYGSNTLALAFNGTTPYVAYQDLVNSYRATVKMYNGSSWVTVGGTQVSPGGVNYVSLAFGGATPSPYITYSDGANNYKASVRMFNGSSWINVGAQGFSAGTAGYLSIAMDGSTPYVAYTDNNSQDKATVMSFATCAPPVTPTVTATANPVCSGSGTTLNISGTLNGAAAWVVYKGGCGAGAAVATTSSSSVAINNTTSTATYYVRGEGGCITTPGACGSASVGVTNISVTATSAPVYPMIGQKMQTVFLNYPGSAQTDSFKVAATSGTAPYSYSWTVSGCNNTTAGTPFSTQAPYTVFAPTAQSICAANSGDNIYTYVATVTDNSGCQATATKRFNVVDPYVGSQIRICHKTQTRTGTSQQIIVTTYSDVVNNHLPHNDALGNCNAFTGRIGASKEAEGDDSPLSSTIRIYPNPSTGIITIDLLEALWDYADVTITDVQGRLIAQRVPDKDGPSAITFDFSSLSRGLYIVTVRNGERSYREKVIIQ